MNFRELKSRQAASQARRDAIVAVQTSVPFIAVQQTWPPDVRFGSKADIPQCRADVRFTPKSGHRLCVLGCPLSAKSGHEPVSFEYRVDG
jgi:hypothetical protein